MALARTTPCTVRQATQLRGPIHALVLVHITAETGGMSGLGQAYALPKGSSVGQAPGSSASQTVPRLSLLVNPLRNPLAANLFSVKYYKNYFCTLK
jgi:hypothetical protein